MDVSGAMPIFSIARRGYNSPLTSTWVAVPGRSSNLYAPVTLGLSNKA